MKGDIDVGEGGKRVSGEGGVKVGVARGTCREIERDENKK